MRRIPTVALGGALALVALLGCKTLDAPREESPTQNVFDRNVNGDIWGIDDRRKWVQSRIYAPADKIAFSETGCTSVVVTIELPLFTETSTGHVGIAIDRRYYDYGPVGQAEKGWVGYSAKVGGGPYWDAPGEYFPNATSTDQIRLRSILVNIDILAKQRTFLVIPMLLSPEHAKLVEAWWVALYQRWRDAIAGKGKYPPYAIPGLHCTSTVVESLYRTDPERKRDVFDYVDPFPEIERLSPMSFARLLLDDATGPRRYGFVQRCGASKGQRFKAILYRRGDDLVPSLDSAVMRPEALLR